MKTGFIYWHPIIYHYVMRLLYGRNFSSRYEAVSSLLPDYANVIDVCCGDCYINKFLAKKKINYFGMDVNSRFVEHALKRGIKAKLFDLNKCSIPQAEYIVMQGSLYQFIPNHRLIMDKIISAAGKAVIISEPIRNIASCQNSVIAFLANLATRVNGSNMPHRFTKAELLELFRDYKASLIKEVEGGRELIGLFVKNNQR